MPEQPKRDSGEVLDDYRRRLDELIDAFWLDAVSGDHKSAELCRKLLQQHALLYGIGGTAPMMPVAANDGDDELAKLRARRTAG